MFSLESEGPMSYQTMAEDQVVHTGQDSSESERDSSKNSTSGSEELKVSIYIACQYLYMHGTDYYKYFNSRMNTPSLSKD